MQRESRSLAHRPRSPQSAKLIARPINPAGASFWYLPTLRGRATPAEVFSQESHMAT